MSSSTVPVLKNQHHFQWTGSSLHMVCYRMCSYQPTVGLVVSGTKQNIFLCTNSQFFSGLMTAQAVDPLPLYRYCPVLVTSDASDVNGKYWFEAIDNIRGAYYQ
jgi:hypothetical protein